MPSLSGMVGRTLVGRRPGVGHLDLHAATLQVKERQRVVLQAAVDVVADREGEALGLADPQLPALARRRHRREVDLLDPISGGAILSERPRLAGGVHLAGGIDQLPGLWRRLGGRYRRDLSEPRQVAYLVH